VSEIRLSVPARADYVHVLRSVIASVAAKLDFSYDDIEDLRLAVDEACAYLLGLRDGPTLLTLSITPTDGSVDVVASVDGAEAAERATGIQANMVWHLLGALTDEARFEEQGGQPGIRFTKSAATSAAR
jgi:serine/threonine-protein kinase RsbW